MIRISLYIYFFSYFTQRSTLFHCVLWWHWHDIDWQWLNEIESSEWMTVDNEWLIDWLVTRLKTWSIRIVQTKHTTIVVLADTKLSTINTQLGKEKWNLNLIHEWMNEVKLEWNGILSSVVLQCILNYHFRIRTIKPINGNNKPGVSVFSNTCNNSTAFIVLLEKVMNKTPVSRHSTGSMSFQIMAASRGSHNR